MNRRARRVCAETRAIYPQFTKFAAAPGLNWLIGHDGLKAMLNWLTGNFEVFGLPGQNWMLVVAGGFLLYIAALAIGRRHAGTR